MDLPVRDAAIAEYQKRHPDVSGRGASDIIALMIASVAREHGAWFWRGVSEAWAQRYPL